MTELTPEQRAERDLMINHLREAVRLGYCMAAPGNGRHGDAVREAFPDTFASPAEAAGVPIQEGDIDKDEHPMVSRANDGAYVQIWWWVPKEDEVLYCSQCGEEMFIDPESGTSHHVGDTPDGIDHDADAMSR